MRPTSILLSIVMLSAWLACKADTAWQQDCGAFVQALSDLASKAKGNNEGNYDKQFEGKKVTWALTFREFGRNEKGEESLLFDLEPFGIRHKFFSGKPVMIGFKPASGTSETWKATPPSSQVRISGIVADVVFAALSPGDNPTRQVSISAASVENVRLVRD